MFLLDAAAADWRSTAMLDSATGRRVEYGELRAEVLRFAEWLNERCGEKTLAFCFCVNRVEAIVAYAGVIEAGHTVALLDETLAASDKRRLIELYQPEWLIGTSPDSGGLEEDASSYRMTSSPVAGLHIWRSRRSAEPPPHADVALLLSTSGSTGSPKFVRLTVGNIRSNAGAIREALRIDARERPITSLPFHYSYGLSVINSHLLAGATIVFSSEALTSDRFWSAVREHECTSLAGVPYSYAILNRLNLERLDVPSLGTLTQAGGKLSTDLVAHFHALMARRGGRLFVMYGQTEATARMTVLPPEALPAKLGSAGRAIPGGTLSIATDDEGGDRHTGEIVYRGPNVMLGYATSRADLARGDELGGILRTGDIGFLDDEGFVFLVGRGKRDAKVFGLRLNLDEVEQMVRVHGPSAVIAGHDKLLIFCEFGDQAEFQRLARELAARLRLHAGACQFRRVAKLPLTRAGKIDYQGLHAQV